MTSSVVEFLIFLQPAAIAPCVMLTTLIIACMVLLFISEFRHIKTRSKEIWITLALATVLLMPSVMLLRADASYIRLVAYRAMNSEAAQQAAQNINQLLYLMGRGLEWEEIKDVGSNDINDDLFIDNV